jgi:hypothetical protein
MAAQVETAVTAQPHVEQHDIRLDVGDQRDRVLRLSGLADDLHAAGIAGQHCAQAIEHDPVIIDNYQPRR